MRAAFFARILNRSFDPVRDCGVYRNKADGSCVHVDGMLCEESCSLRQEYADVRAKVPVLEASGDNPIVYQYRYYEANPHVVENCRGWQEWVTCDEQKLVDIRTYISRGLKYQIRILRESRVEGFSPS